MLMNLLFFLAAGAVAKAQVPAWLDTGDIFLNCASVCSIWPVPEKSLGQT